jgi:hypothetical protein
MRFDLSTRETLVLFFGMLGLLEQEAVRLLFDLAPSSVLSGMFGTMVLGSIGAGVFRGSLNGNGTSETKRTTSRDSGNGGR